MRLSRLQVYNTLIRTGLVPVFSIADSARAATFMQACVAGGVKVFEFTNRGATAFEVFHHLRQTFPEHILGIGSIIDAPTAALYIAHGADFVVSPVFDVATAELCHLRKIAYLPGCGSASEIQQAHRIGVEIVKLFPAHHYGADFVKSILAPMPHTRIMPTGGIAPTEDAIREWFQAGVSCVGIGSKLQKVDNVTTKCQHLLTWIARYREDDGYEL